MESSTETMSAVYDIHHATVPSEEDRRSRIIPGLPSISQSIRKTIITLTEPLSPSQSEIDLESGPSTPSLAFEKLRRWSTSRKSETSSLAPRPLTPREHPSLTNLPHELQILILTFLGFGDIEHLRRTSRYWYNFATPRLVRSIYGPDTFRAMLIKHCRVCLTYCPRDVTRVATTRFDPGFPLSSRCVKCTVQSKDGTVRIGHRVKLGNLTDVWTCRWCGWPVTGEPSAGNPQFHRNCYDKYTGVLLGFFALGWIQFFIGVVASALVWFYFRDNLVVMAPTIAGFALMFVCIILIMFRGNRVRTYHWALLIELAMVGLWIPSIYLIAKEFMIGNGQQPAQAIVAFVALNMLFRIINIIGNVILICDYDRTKHYVPRIPIWRRFMNPVMTALIFWTYPQHAERRYGPDWN